jgi:hypothetical protein
MTEMPRIKFDQMTGYCWKCGYPIVGSSRTTCGDIACNYMLQEHKDKTGKTYWSAVVPGGMSQYIEFTREEAIRKAAEAQAFINCNKEKRND